MLKTEFLSHRKHPLSPLQRPLSLSCLRNQSAYFEIHIKPGKTSVVNVQSSGNAKAKLPLCFWGLKDISKQKTEQHCASLCLYVFLKNQMLSECPTFFLYLMSFTYQSHVFQHLHSWCHPQCLSVILVNDLISLTFVLHNTPTVVLNIKLHSKESLT